MLSREDRAFVRSYAAGLTLREIASDTCHSPHWAKWKSRQVRARLGVATMKEAVRLSEVTREDLDALRRDLTSALRDVKDAATPRERQEARQELSDLDGELRRLGLSRDDLEKLREEKEYQRFKSFEDRRQQEREAEEKTRREQEEAEQEAERVRAEQEAAEKKRDGLGGRRNR